MNIKCVYVDPRHLPRLAGLTSDDSNAQWAAVPAKSPDWRCWENTFHGMTLFSSQWCFCCLTWTCIDNHAVIFFGCFCSLVELVEWPGADISYGNCSGQLCFHQAPQAPNPMISLHSSHMSFHLVQEGFRQLHVEFNYCNYVIFHTWKR